MELIVDLKVEVEIESSPTTLSLPAVKSMVRVKRLKINISGREGREKVWTSIENLRPTDIVID